jgi:polysaccharide export outer membrane protein
MSAARSGKLRVMHLLKGILAGGLFVLYALCAGAQERQPEYQLGPGDNIRILVFQNPELTLETRVSENGTITYPLVGAVRVGGMTIAAAEQTIARALAAGNYIERPQVNIVLLQNRGNQVSVLGQVTRPGRFPLETFNTRLSEMVAIAGGIAPSGADVAILVGTRNGQPYRKEIDIAGMFLGNKLDEDVVVAGGDVIYVHRMPMFYVYGEVQRAGSYRVERGMTVRQALAQAGGPTNRGTERGILVYRRAADARVQTLTPELNELVQPDDVLFVRETVF